MITALLFILCLHYIHNICKPIWFSCFLFANLLSLILLKVNPILGLDIIFPKYLLKESISILLCCIFSLFNLALVLGVLGHKIVSFKGKVLLYFLKYKINPSLKWSGILIFILNVFVYPLFIVKWSSIIGQDIFHITSFHIEYFSAIEKILFPFLTVLYLTFFSYLVAIISIIPLFSELRIYRDILNVKFAVVLLSIILNIIYFFEIYHHSLNIFDIKSQKILLIESSYNNIPNRCKNIINLESKLTAEQENFEYIKFIDGSTVSLAKWDNEKNDYKFAVGHCYNDKQGYYKLLNNEG